MIILHGDHSLLSRKKLSEITADFKGETIRLSAQKLDLTNLKQALESQSLFGQERLVVIENLFSRRPSREKDSILAYLKKELPESLVAWEEKTIDGRKLASFSKATVQKFQLTPLIFKLLDSLAPGNSFVSLNCLHQCLKQDSTEMIFYMLAKRIGLLLMAQDGGEAGLTAMAPWQKKRLVGQAGKFDESLLRRLHQELLKIDYYQKTGKTVLSLESQLDLWLASF